MKVASKSIFFCRGLKLFELDGEPCQGNRWADIVLFANTQTTVIEEKVGIGGVKKRGVGPTERFMYTQETPAFKAKCRWPVPPKLPLSYQVLETELAKAKATVFAARNPSPVAA